VGSLSVIYSYGDEEGDDEVAESCIWDAGETLEMLPTIPDLSLTGPFTLRLTPSAKFETLTTLSLKRILNVDVLAVLSLCNSPTFDSCKLRSRSPLWPRLPLNLFER